MPSRLLRSTIVVVVTAAATGAIGFGGLASWAVTTQDNGSSVASGTVHHSDVATVAGGAPVSCTDNSGTCGAIFSLTAARPGATTTGTVQITNTGSLASTFTLSLSGATTSGAGTTLCSSLTATIVDAEAPSATVYSGPLTSMPTSALKAQNGATAWNAGDTDTFSFTLTLPTSSPATDQGSTCSATLTWAQTNV